jgi:hypothetical protein
MLFQLILAIIITLLGLVGFIAACRLGKKGA